MEVIGWILYGLFVVIFTFYGEISLGTKVLENKLNKIIACLVAYPLIGLIFWLFGWIFAFLSKLILAPFANIF